MKIKTIIGTMALTLLMSSTVLASEIKLIVDGNVAEMDVPPLIVEGTSYVPLRALLENTKSYVIWEEYKNIDIESIAIGDRAIRLKYYPETKTIFTSSAEEYGYYQEVTFGLEDSSVKTDFNFFGYDEIKEYKLKNKIIIKDGRSLLPLREVSEIYGFDIQWNGDTKTINVDTSFPMIKNSLTGDNVIVEGAKKRGDYTPEETKEVEVTKENNERVLNINYREDWEVEPVGVLTERPKVGDIPAKILKPGEDPNNITRGLTIESSGFTPSYTMFGASGQCTWYAYGRFHEVYNIYDYKFALWGNKLKQAETEHSIKPIYNLEDIVKGALAVRVNKDPEKSGHLEFIEWVDYDSNGKPTYVYFSEANAGDSANNEYDHGEDGKIKKLSFDKYVIRAGSTLTLKGYIVPRY